MPIISLPAHFDGKQICLDEPFNLKPNSKLIITILSEQDTEEEHNSWLIVSSQKLIDAYGENEPEYSIDMLKEVNPQYEAR